jgi:hypothetical protein
VREILFLFSILATGCPTVFCPILTASQYPAATFSSGVKFEFNIDIGANLKETGQAVGLADNTFETFTIIKDDNRVIFRTGDGFECKSVYFAH